MKFFLLTLLIIFFPLTLFGQPLLALAQADPYGLNTTAQNAGLITGGEEPPRLTIMVGRVINWGLGLLGVVFLVLIIAGGAIWMTAAGNEEKVKKAKMIIGAATVGLTIVFLAYSLTNMIVERLTSATATGGQFLNSS